MEIKGLYVMEFPRNIYLGRGLMEKVPDLLTSWGFRNPLYIVGDYTKRYAHGEKVIVKEARKETLDEVQIPHGTDVLVGIGGGKNLDATKYLSKVHDVSYVLVPTLPSSDGIASPAISLLQGRGRISLLHKPPLSIIIDFDVIASSPKLHILSGYGDIVAKYSSVYDWYLGHLRTGEYFGYLTSRLESFAFRHVVRKRNRLLSPEGVHVLLESLILSGGCIGIQGTSRPASGSEHLISHAMDTIRMENDEKPGMHGLQVGLATIFTSYLQGRNWRYIRRILGEAGHPTTLQGIGADADLFTDAVIRAPSLRKRYTILNEVKLNRSRIRTILEEVGLE